MDNGQLPAIGFLLPAWSEKLAVGFQLSASGD